MSVLWRGNLATRLRIASGLVLFTYVLFHFLNIGLGLFSMEWLDWGQRVRQTVTRSMLGGLVLYAALFTHIGLALTKIAMRRTLRMPKWEALQVILGLIIPLLLITHVVHTRMAHEFFDVNDRMSFIMVLIWGTADGWRQSFLLLIVWVHACLGLHFWLRFTSWWGKAAPFLSGAAVFVPAFALAGFLTEGRRVKADFADESLRVQYFEEFNFPDLDTFQILAGWKEIGLAIFWTLLGLTLGVYLVRKFISSRNAVRIQYVDGPEISSPIGPTLLEISRMNGIPHTALCGGKGRCTTCRVIVEDGLELLHPPGETERRSLRAVNAPPNARLACQIKPTKPATVFRVFRPDGKHGRAHSSQGKERRLAILFLDMRGFTARTTGQLPYDVVFLLNRFFDAIVPAITEAGGTVDKYLGDGLLAVFETADECSSARAALRASSRIGKQLEEFNRVLAGEDAPEVRIGIGLHLGNLVLGEIGAAGNAPRTLIGDTVNAASRLEGETKTLGVELLISEAVLDSARIDKSDLELITLELRGVPEPIRALKVQNSAGIDERLKFLPAEEVVISLEPASQD